MKAITIKQPWASLIVEGIKDVENRTWKTKFRGRVLIHVSKQFIHRPLMVLNEDQYKSVQDHHFKTYRYPISENNSCIIGSVEIVDCVINHDSIWAEKGFKTETEEKGLVYHPVYNWVLANPIKFEKPIPNIKGKLSFWDFDIDSYEPVK